MDDFPAQGVLQQILQSVLGKVLFAVEVDGQPGVQVDVVPHHLLHVFHLEAVVGEETGIRGKDDLGPAASGRGFHGRLFHQYPLFEGGGFGLAVADGLHHKTGREGVHGLGTHPIQTDGLFKGLGVVLGARVHLGNGVHHFAQRNAAAKIPNGHGSILHGNFNGLAGAHHKLVDGVVHHLLDQDVNAIVRRRSVPHFADVHAWAEPDVLLPFQAADVVLVVLNDVGHGLKVRD